jgi:glutamate racemase
MVKVGFFDSGIGGKSILNEFKKLCPQVETEYLADKENLPYGNKQPSEIVGFAEANAAKLIANGCSIVVVACNTATAAAIDLLRAKYPSVPFVGVEPAVKPAAQLSKTGVIGVLATAGTFNGRLYNETKEKFAKNVKVISVIADEFVVEAERLEGREVESLDQKELGRIEEVVRLRIEPILEEGADVIVLGCTHFPHLKKIIEKVCAGRAQVVDSSLAVAKQIMRVLEKTK